MVVRAVVSISGGWPHYLCGDVGHLLADRRYPVHLSSPTGYVNAVFEAVSLHDHRVHGADNTNARRVSLAAR